MLRAKLTIAGSNFIFSHINENYGEYLSRKKKLRVIFRGINIDYFNSKNISVLKQEKLKQEWNLSSNKFTILLPGRLTYWKGQEKFIESLNILIEDYNVTNFQAVILGSDQGRKVYSKKLVNLVERYNLNKKVIFISHCKDMPLAYSLADAVVSASIEPEAFGRVSVEAQSMGKPIIATNIGDISDFLSDKVSAVIAEPNVNSIYDSIEFCLNNVQEAIKIGKNGQKEALKAFDIELNGKKMLNFLINI